MAEEIGWEERLRILIGDTGVQRLAESRVAVFGLGGVGSYAAECLARSGIGNLVLVDFDVVSKTNLNRQLIALTPTIGRLKTEVMAERIRNINTNCNITIESTFIDQSSLGRILEKPLDGAIDAIDVVTSKLSLIQALQERQINFISSLGMGGRLDPTQLVITTLAATAHDPLAKILRQLARRRGISLEFPVVFSKEVPAARAVGSDPMGTTRKERHPIGSSAFVPAAAGLAAGSYIVRKIIEDKE